SPLHASVLHRYYHHTHDLLLTPPHTPYLFFSFNHPPPTTIYTLSLHDALPIFLRQQSAGLELEHVEPAPDFGAHDVAVVPVGGPDRKSTRLNSSHRTISYAVFCLKKKKKKKKNTRFEARLAGVG